MIDQLIQYIREINQVEYDCNVMLSQEYDSLLNDQITNKQVILLGLVHEHGQINTSEIADKLGITSSAVSQLLGKLEKSGYIKRSINTGNRREIIIELDEHGREYMDRSRQIEMSIIERYYAKLGMEDIMSLRTIMLRLKYIIETEQARERQPNVGEGQTKPK